MNVHVAIRSADCPLHQRPAPHLPTEPETLRLARRLVVFTPSGQEIAAMADRARGALPMLADAAVVQRVVSFNPDSVWAIARQSSFDVAAPRGEGFVGFLMLNAEGLRQLRTGAFNGADPDLALLTPQNEKPAAIYFWVAYAPGMLAAGVPLALQKIWTPLYRDVDIYSRSINATAVRFVEGMGFRKHIEPDGTNIEHLYIYRRSEDGDGPPPSYDRRAPERGGVSIRVARTFEDLAKVVSIRGAVYMAEQVCPYDEEFDGNDLAATHLLASIDGEPCGCIRMRFFAEFAKIERLAVRREFRGNHIAVRLAEAAIDLCRMKGYGRICGHSAHHMVNFWSRFGFSIVGNGEGFTFSDFEYVLMSGDFEPHPQAVRFASDPYVVLRPEGGWHKPGVLDRSKVRPVTAPSIAGVPA